MTKKPYKQTEESSLQLHEPAAVYQMQETTGKATDWILFILRQVSAKYAGRAICACNKPIII